MQYKNLPVSAIRKFCEDFFLKRGFNTEESFDIVDVIITSDLYGIESHGIQRMFRYYRILDRGFADPKAKPRIIFRTPVSAVIDGTKTMGQITAKSAMQMAIGMAQEHMFGAVTVRNCNHFGIAGYYSRMAANVDLLGFSSTNTEAIALPTNGKQPMLGTSPLAVCMPADPYFFWFDAATTVVPRGKLEIYNKLGRPLPEGWASDEFGNSCSDAKHVMDNLDKKNFGGIFPIGGFSTITGSHKGYGLGVIAEMFTAIFSGGHTSPHVENAAMGDTSFCFMALDYGIFGDKREIRERMSQLLRELRESPKADGQERIYTHGEKVSVQEKLKIGIPVNNNTLAELKMIGESAGLDFDSYFHDSNAF
jgi:L-2-hydroxycarboxylate dehydrogenase (NAD+)